MAPGQLDFHYAICGKFCGILAESHHKKLKFFSCQLLMDFGRRDKPLFFNHKCVEPPVENSCSPGKADHAGFRAVSTIRCEREVTKGLFVFPGASYFC
jgi:hypothetical protein